MEDIEHNKECSKDMTLKHVDARSVTEVQHGDESKTILESNSVENDGKHDIETMAKLKKTESRRKKYDPTNQVDMCKIFNISISYFHRFMMFLI